MYSRFIGEHPGRQDEVRLELTLLVRQVKTLMALYPNERGHQILQHFDLAISNAGGSIVLGALAANMELGEIDLPKIRTPSPRAPASVARDRYGYIHAADGVRRFGWMAYDSPKARANATDTLAVRLQPWLVPDDHDFGGIGGIHQDWECRPLVDATPIPADDRCIQAHVPGRAAI